MKFFFDNMENYRGKLLGAFVGFLIALAILLLGVFKSLFIIFCTGIGYYIGKLLDEKTDLRELLDRILPPSNLK